MLLDKTFACGPMNKVPLKMETMSEEFLEEAVEVTCLNRVCSRTFIGLLGDVFNNRGPPSHRT